jgi:hypothetical protein
MPPLLQTLRSSSVDVSLPRRLRLNSRGLCFGGRSDVLFRPDLSPLEFQDLLGRLGVTLQICVFTFAPLNFGEAKLW